MTRVDFTAPEYQPDGSIRRTRYGIAGAPDVGWTVQRDGADHLALGPGYRLLAVRRCGVCATDLARRHLPFRLPQITGHEVVACDEDGHAVGVEINASHAARGLPRDAWCARCRAGLATHCPDRLVLGIHDLPGGFGPWILAPRAGVVPLGDGIDPATAVLLEPFAAALHAADAVAPRAGDVVAVVGPGRLGSLVVAALAARRAAGGPAIDIVAVGRRDDLLDRARRLGADRTMRLADAVLRPGLAAIVVETTGSADGLGLALTLATREVHVKSTTGQPTLGLRHLTALVVDEVSVGPLREPPPDGTVVCDADVPVAVRRAVLGGGARLVSPAEAAALPLGGADVVVATSLDGVDRAIRPRLGVERGVVRPRGRILLAGAADGGSPLAAAIATRGLVVSTSRCGELRAARDVLADPALGTRLARLLVGGVVPASRLSEAFAQAAAGGTKIVVTHPE